jgi:solute carrier family 35 protein F1/2
MIILYTVAPLLYRMASSAYYNLSLLSSDFYGLLFGLFLFHYQPFWLYFPAFAVVLVGLIVYFWTATRKRSSLRLTKFLGTNASIAEEQGKLDPQPPVYVQKMRGI